MRLRWTAPAAQDLYQITRYIQRDNPAAAHRVAKTIYGGCESLVNSPRRGRIGQTAGTRELVFPGLPYIAASSVHNEIIEIPHIWHGAQRRGT